MFDNFTAYVAAVDGRPVAAGRAGWNSPLALPAGPRRLTVIFIRGAFTAQTDLQLPSPARSDLSIEICHGRPNFRQEQLL